MAEPITQGLIDATLLTQGFDISAGQSSFRDRDIRQAIASALVATKCFDFVGQYAEAESHGFDSGYERAVVIEPGTWTASSPWGNSRGDDDNGIVMDAECKLYIMCRHEDPIIRDETAEVLANLVCNEINGNSFGGITFGQIGIVTRMEWKPETPPERLIVATYSYSYEVKGFRHFNTTE